MKSINTSFYSSSTRPSIYSGFIITRADTGWDCCVCGFNATVQGDGFTWCWGHWKKWNLGKGKSIEKMKKEWKNKHGV